MSTEITFQLHIIEARGLPRSSSMFSSSNVYLSVKVDGEKFGKSDSVESSPVAAFNFHTSITCPATSRQLVLEVKRGGLLGISAIGGCSLNIAAISRMDREQLPLYSYDSNPQEVGSLNVSIERRDQVQSASSAVPGGLVNRAGTTDLNYVQSQRPPAPVTAIGTWDAIPGGQVAPTVTSAYAAPGGLTNYAGSNPSNTTRQSMPVGTIGLQNHAMNPEAGRSSIGMNRQGTGLNRQGTAGLANLAATDDDGKRATALPRVQELLESLTPFSPSDEDQRTKLSQALEELRHVPGPDLKKSAGKTAVQGCSSLIEAIFEHAIARQDKKEMDGAIWLAGRLPMNEDDTGVTLQDVLRRRWDHVQMDNALAQANSLVSSAGQNTESLEKLMDAIDLTEFHASFAGKDSASQVSRILTQLKPRIQSKLEGLLRSGTGLDEAENIFSILGAARVESLGLRSMQQEFQRFQSLNLLKSALQPLSGQVGFPPLKDRQLRHAISVVRTAIADDASGRTQTAVRALLLQDMLPVCMGHGNESTLAVLRTAFQVQLSADEVWTAAKSHYASLPDGRKQDLTNKLQRFCAELRQDLPGWLLSSEQLACQQALRNALKGSNPATLQQACQKVMETPGGPEVCMDDMRMAITRLQETYRLPDGWNVESMLASGDQKLLRKVELDGRIVQLFDQLLKQTTQASVRTRDRRGAVPRAYTAVRAIEIMNATNWQTYANRRDEIAKECRQIRARTDDEHWRDNLNGFVDGGNICERIAQMTTQPPLEKSANEFWLIHGTTHAAADGISSTDFDMARASPSGLFGAGIYFAESISKSDEYVQGKSERGVETFPLLICRVTLGYVYYCDQRGPDRRQLEDRCLRQQWHSVLGDRKKTSGTFREFVVYDNVQAFPAYIVYYTRQY